MDQSSNSNNPPERYICPLTLEVMENPVRIRTTGHTFEKGAILRWVVTKRKFTCPLTRKPVHPGDLIEDERLKQEIQSWKYLAELEEKLEQITFGCRDDVWCF